VRLLRVVHSDVTRAAQTAAIISKALPPNVAVEVDTLLAEGYPCIPEPCRVEVCPLRRSCPRLFALTRASSLSPAPLRSHPRLFTLTRAFDAAVRVRCSRGVGTHRGGVQEIL
jgi:hypothetical protein